MWKNQEIPSQFIINPSARLALLIAGLHGASLLGCWLTGLPILYKFILSLCVAASWLFQKKTDQANSQYLRYTQDNGWYLSSDGLSYVAISLLASTVVGRMLTVLHFNVDRRRKSMVIFNDAMTATEYRRLIVLLKISGSILDDHS